MWENRIALRSRICWLYFRAGENCKFPYEVLHPKNSNICHFLKYCQNLKKKEKKLVRKIKNQIHFEAINKLRGQNIVDFWPCMYVRGHIFYPKRGQKLIFFWPCMYVILSMWIVNGPLKWVQQILMIFCNSLMTRKSHNRPKMTSPWCEFVFPQIVCAHTNVF